jgi:glycosyltransferase involved in cell wall biosynthesis
MVAARYLPFMGGVETHVHEVSSRLARLGVDITVLTTDTTRELDSSERHDGVTVRRFPAYPKRSDLYWSPALSRSLATGEFDLVHVQGVHTLVPPMALASAGKSRVPTVLTFHTGGHSSGLRTSIRELQWRALRKRLRTVDRLVAVCDYETVNFGRRLGLEADRFRLIRNGSDRLPVGTEKSAWSGDPLIASVGRLEKYKGHHRAIKAMPQMLARRPDARLVIVGRGPYASALHRLVDDLGVGASVDFVAFEPEQREQLGTLLATCDVVVLMSEYEAHPVAVMEAVGLGRPVVVANTSGLSELGAAGLVTLVDLEATPGCLVEALLHAAPPDLSASGLVSWDECVTDLAELYSEVLRV